MNDENKTYAMGKCTGSKDIKFGRAGTGTEQIGLLFRTVEGQCHAWYGSLGTEESIALVEGVLRACGWDGKSWTELGGIASNEVQLTFVDGKLEYVNAPGVGMRDQLEPGDRAALLGRLNRRKR